MTHKTNFKENGIEMPLSQPEVRFSLDELDGLSEFLRSKGCTLLIKGYAGTGKTTLAAELLRHFGKNGKTAYVSSRVSEAKIQTQLPLFSEINREGDFADVRLGNASTIIEQVLNYLTQKGSAISLIVLDTWDGLAKEMDERERLKAEKTLIALADRSDSRIVFVSEEPGKTTMDYLVDGIVELVRSEEYGRIFREMEIQKLRGTSVRQHKYLYTLAGGRFSHIPPYAEPDLSKARKFEPMQDLDASRRYSFGSKTLDSIFGGIKKGSTFTLQYTKDVRYSAIRMVHVPPIINFLSMGRSALLIPLLGVSVEEITSLIRPFVSEEAFRERFRIATTETKQGEVVHPPLFAIGHGPVSEEHAKVTRVVEELKSKSVDRNVLVVDCLSFLENLFASNMEGLLETLADRVTKSQRFGDSSLLLLQSDSGISSRILSMSESYASMFVRDNAVILFGGKPNTEAYAVYHGENPLLPDFVQIV